MVDAQLNNIMKIQKAGSAPRKKGLIILGIMLAFVLFLLGVIMGSVFHLMTSGLITFFVAVFIFLVVHFIYNNRKLSDSVLRLSDEVKERHMGRLFENFEAYDVQATRRAAREEGMREGIEQDIMNLIKTHKKHIISKDDTAKDLTELYHLSDEEAQRKNNIKNPDIGYEIV